MIYNKLYFKPLSTSIDRFIISPKKSLLDYGLFKSVTEYEHTLGRDAHYNFKSYTISNDFLNNFNIGVVILNLPFGISVTFISESNKFGEDTYSTKLNNFYFEVIDEENRNKKEKNINAFFKKQFLTILEQQNSDNIKMESSLSDELLSFQESTTKLGDEEIKI